MDVSDDAQRSLLEPARPGSFHSAAKPIAPHLLVCHLVLIAAKRLARPWDSSLKQRVVMTRVTLGEITLLQPTQATTQSTAEAGKRLSPNARFFPNAANEFGDGAAVPSGQRGGGRAHCPGPRHLL